MVKVLAFIRWDDKTVEYAAAYEAIGKGEAAFLVLADSLIRTSMTIREAASVAIYIMSKVKEQVPDYGGNTDLVMLSQTGIETHVPTQHVKEIELHHLDIELRKHEEVMEESISRWLRQRRICFSDPC